jgi:16S rRNA (cytosine1402-N4)-methyltransferase
MHTSPNSEPRHIPVLLQPVLDNLAIKQDGTYFDGTLGGGGHAEKIIEHLCSSGVFVGVDKDEHVLTQTSARIRARFTDNAPRIVCSVAGFEDVLGVLTREGIAHLDGALLDLGWGNHTLTAGRGFSFLKDEPLLMTYAVPGTETLTAFDIVNTWSLDTLTTIFRYWGEEKRARHAAYAIVEARERAEIATTAQLVAIIERVIPRVGKMHPATRIFQAVRIAVNRELEILDPTLTSLRDLLNEGGRICVITFHSGEDRIVKQLFNTWAREKRGSHITKHVIAPSREETLSNPRARSAKLRVFEKNTQSTNENMSRASTG